MSVATASDYDRAILQARRAYHRAPPTLAVCDPRGAFLEGTDGNVTSQNGEDGLIAAVFARIGTRDRWCFEVGAHDGVHLSNTWALRQAGWHAVLIEADGQRFAELSRRTEGDPNVRALCSFVGPLRRGVPLDCVLARTEIPRGPDLGVIDVDGPDVFVWEGMRSYAPRVMLVEFNPSGDGVQGGQPNWQAGLARTAEVGRQKGYALLATTPHNALFVLESQMKGAGC